MIKVKKSNKIEPAISLPEKFVEPILMATNSLPSILRTSSKLFCPTFTSTGFFFSSVTIFLTRAIRWKAMRHHLKIFIFICCFPHFFVNKILALRFCHLLLQNNLIANVLPDSSSIPPHCNNKNISHLSCVVDVKHLYIIPLMVLRSSRFFSFLPPS